MTVIIRQDLLKSERVFDESVDLGEDRQITRHHREKPLAWPPEVGRWGLVCMCVSVCALEANACRPLDLFDENSLRMGM